MKFPSIKIIQEQFISTFERFPLALISAIICAYIGCSLISNSTIPQDENLIHLLMTFYLGMISFVSINLFFSRYTFRISTQWIINGLIAALMYFYFSRLPEKISAQYAAEFIILVMAAHLSVSFFPYLVIREINGFWQYNKLLFLRFLTSTLYSSVLFIGLSLAFLAINKLFDVNIPDKTYGYLWCMIGVVFNTWFFLSGIPVNIKQLNTVEEYPNGLRIFTQFVLLPLVTIYLVILYAYFLKIIFTMTWPHGWVSYLVVGFSTAGILALLLVWPLRDDEKHKWISNYTKGFFIALFPLILLLCFAIGRRVSEYGITEKRFFIIALALWLFVNAIYFLISKNKYIKVIPMSLFVVVILSGFGPFSAFSISEKNQIGRLEKILFQNKILVNGKVLPNKVTVSNKDLITISSTINYICEFHSYRSLQPFFKQNLDSLLIPKKDEYIFKPTKIMDLMGLEYSSSYNEQNDNSDGFTFHYSSRQSEFIKCTGYDYNFNFNIYCYNAANENNFTDSIWLDSIPFIWNYQKGTSLIKINYDQDSTVFIDLKPFVYNLRKSYGSDSYDIVPDKMLLNFQKNRIFGQLYIHDINFKMKPDSSNFELNSLEAKMLIGVNFKK